MPSKALEEVTSKPDQHSAIALLSGRIEHGLPLSKEDVRHLSEGFRAQPMTNEKASEAFSFAHLGVLLFSDPKACQPDAAMDYLRVARDAMSNALTPWKMGFPGMQLDQFNRVATMLLTRLGEAGHGNRFNEVVQIIAEAHKSVMSESERLDSAVLPVLARVPQ